MLFENILHEFSWEIISEASKTPINIAVQHFEQTNVYRDILLPKLGKNMSMALQNMIESHPPPPPPPPPHPTHTHTHTHTTLNYVKA